MKSILIVDDQYGIRVLLNEFFKKGYNMFQAASGMQALKVLEEHEIDLIFLDIKLPGMDGIEFYKRAKEKGFQNFVMTMSAYDEYDKIQEAKDLGALFHFSKPIDLNELLNVVIELVPVEDKSVFEIDSKRLGSKKRKKIKAKAH